MRRKYFANRFVRFVTICLLAIGLTDGGRAQPLPGYVLSGPMLPLLVQMPENGWLSVNVNFFSDVWTPPELEPLVGAGVPPQSTIIQAWSGFAWDSNRGDVILYGGGHANYSGNDVYRWRSSTLRWERASLPSEIWDDPVSGFQSIDGVDAAPSSAHTYVNNLFLPIADRFLTWGGGAYNNGGPYLRVSETNPTQIRFVGPYLFDPNRADGNKVGGTTGSHVMRVSPHPEIVGGQMWENRDIYLHLAGQELPGRYSNGCTAYVAEGGHDVVYVAANYGLTTDIKLYRYQLTNLANPALDQIATVGAHSVGSSDQTTCGYDPVRKLFVRTGTNDIPFSFWDLTTPGPNNLDQLVQVDATIASLQSWMTSQNIDMLTCALVFDPVRRTFPLWCGAATIWELHPPPSAITASGWTVTQRPAPQTSAPPGYPTSVLGKWHYAPYYDVLVGLEDINDGNIWIYKPVGWVQPNPPGNALPSVTITSPVDGATVAPGALLNLTATASDPDGSIARVEFYVNETKVGQATSSPYTVGLTPLFVGTYTVVAVAVDNVGGMKASVPVGFTVSAQLTTATLQRGLSAYAGVTDTFLVAYDPGTPYGASSELYLDPVTYAPLVRFAIFQSEGGPVPNGAVIQSAMLELYKQYYDDPLRLSALLKPWVEAQATWTESRAGTAWSVSGAAGAGTDYDVAADALVSGDWNPGWVAFDVTPRVQQWSNLSVANYGWRLAQVGPNGNFKEFYSSEYSTDPTLRPKLTIVYAPKSKVPTSVTLASSANPSIVATSVSFTAAVTGIAPTGSVNFKGGGTPIAGCSAIALTGIGNTRTAQCTTNSLSVGAHGIVAAYGGDAANAASNSPTLSQNVNPAVVPTTTTLVSSANPSAFGASVTFTATVAGIGPTGSVNFKADGSNISGCTAVGFTGGTVNARKATCATSSLSVATHSIVANYSGDAGNTASSSAPLSQVVNPPALNDLDGNGTSDLFWQSPSTGQGAFWFMKAGAVNSTSFFTLPPGWLPQGVGDFNGDGKADIVWTSPSTNQVAIWLMNGSTVSSTAYFGVPSTWSIAAIGDFNGDGRADILWRNVNGQIESWLMNGATIQSVVYYNNVDASWSVVGTGDFYDDGKSEVVLSHQPDGALYLWRSADQATPQVIALGTPGGTWRLAAIGDFDGDGEADLFLRDATGANAIWRSGLSASTVFPPGVGTSWSVMTAKQLYGDDISALVWRRNDGLVALWDFDATLTSPTTTYLQGVPLNWSQVGQ